MDWRVSKKNFNWVAIVLADTILIGLTRLTQTQTLYFYVMFVSGSRILSKIVNPTFEWIRGGYESSI